MSVRTTQYSWQQCGETTDANKMNEYELQRTTKPPLGGNGFDSTETYAVPALLTESTNVNTCSVQVGNNTTAATPLRVTFVPILNGVHMNEMNKLHRRRKPPIGGSDRQRLNAGLITVNHTV